MNQEDLIGRIKIELAEDDKLQALFLAGSFGRGDPDEFSDVDLLALVEVTEQAGFAAEWRPLLERITPIVFWNELHRGGILLNAISLGWLRCDLLIIAPEQFTNRARDTVQPVIDVHGYYDRLPAKMPLSKPNPARVEHIINEFIRVLGLLSVAMGRGEYVTAVSGTELLRNLLQNLMLESVTTADKGGILHLSKLLPPDQMQLLATLPCPRPERPELIEANIAVAKAFFPRARRLADKIGVQWPQAFEDATRRHLAKKLGSEFGEGW